jgi:hypothetical protein
MDDLPVDVLLRRRSPYASPRVVWSLTKWHAARFAAIFNARDTRTIEVLFRRGCHADRLRRRLGRANEVIK